MPTQRIHIGPRASIAAQLTDQVASDARAAIAARGRFLLAIPGGSVADAVLPRLAGCDIAWDCVHFFWCDERAVPLDDPDSNAGAAMHLWAGSPLARSAHLHIMDGGAVDLDAACRAYERALVGAAGDPPVLDLVLLGMGEDGHVASLFPGHPASTEARRFVMPVLDARKPPPRRLTLTMPVLLGARHVVIATFGSGKANAVREAFGVPDARSPAACIVASATRLTMMLDVDAGRGVPLARRSAIHE